MLPPSVRSGDSKLGRVYYAEQFWPLEHRHGCYALDQAFDLDEVARHRLSDGLSVEDIREAAFIDIETSGLDGKGSHPFLVGVGSFEGLSFRLRQYFLPEISGERAMLAAVAETIERKSVLVSFNGRTFDMPQLVTRYAMHGLRCFDDVPHVDLLQASRKLYGRSLDSRRLGEVERSLLGLDREEDIPSWLIPSLYFSYMQRGQAQALHPVFLHNALDVLSLVTLLAHLGLDAGADILNEGDAEHLVALGRWDEARGESRQASQMYSAVLSRDRVGNAGGEAAARLARFHRRDGSWDDCERIWQSELDSERNPVRRLNACVELAKIAEHRHRDYGRALSLTSEAADILGSLQRYQRPLSPTLTTVQQRYKRLQARVARHGKGTKASLSPAAKSP